MRAIVYARVSSGAQRDRHTIASQLRDVPAYCAAQGWEVEVAIRPGAQEAGRLTAGLLELRLRESR